MFGTALQTGLRAWSRAPITAGIGAAVALGLLVLAYAFAIQVSMTPWLSLGLWAVLANLALAGWISFCVTLIDGPQRWLALLSGFRRPLPVSVTGLATAGIVLILIQIVHYLNTNFVMSNWLGPIGYILIVGFIVPVGMMSVISAAKGKSLPIAVTTGIKSARQNWFAFFFLTILTFGLVVAGMIPGLLLERHALNEISGMLPTQFAEYGLAIVRLITLLGFFAGVSAAGCIWAAAWRAADAAP